jgi:hypothetical protein
VPRLPLLSVAVQYLSRFCLDRSGIRKYRDRDELDVMDGLRQDSVHNFEFAGNDAPSRTRTDTVPILSP